MGSPGREESQVKSESIVTPRERLHDLSNE